MASHPNKHIRAAVEYAISRGWTLKKSGPAHTCGADCIVLKAIGLDVLKRSTRRLACQKIIPKTSAEPWITVRTDGKF